jgi:hypothetical protein
MNYLKARLFWTLFFNVSFGLLAFTFAQLEEYRFWWLTMFLIVFNNWSFACEAGRYGCKKQLEKTGN